MRPKIDGRVHEALDDRADDAPVHVLREVPGRVSPKVGCGSGECGACAVLAD